MPRRARLAVAGIPWHIIQRGDNPLKGTLKGAEGIQFMRPGDQTPLTSQDNNELIAPEHINRQVNFTRSLWLSYDQRIDRIRPH